MTEAARPEPVALSTGIGVTQLPRAISARVASLVRDRRLHESAALLLPIAVVGVFHARGPALWVVGLLYALTSALVATRGPRRGRLRSGSEGWTIVRLLLGVSMVAAAQLFTGETGLLAAVYLPIIALAAFAGLRPLGVAVAASVAAQLGVEMLSTGQLAGAAADAVGFAAAAGLVAAGTHREVARMRRARDRLRHARTLDRRRSRQIAGVEAIGRTLAESGPTQEAFDAVVRRISREFGYRYVSMYLGNDRAVTFGAQRGYTELVPGFDGTVGIVGRVMRTHEPAFVPDVASDPDYWGLNPDVTSEICAPLLADGEFLGFVNVEATDHALDDTDLRVMVAVADRMAAALIIGRERQRLAERADLFRHLHEFSEAINGTLQPHELFEAITRSVSAVIPVDEAALHVIDRETGRYLLRAVSDGAPPSALGSEVRPGTGMAGRAIRDRVMVLDQPTAGASAAGGPAAAASVPLIRDRSVLGALTLTRHDPSSAFTKLERDALAMVAEQAALAVTNVQLHAEVAELAMRDPLTGLFNRRYLDPALEQLLARRERQPAGERVPLAAIMFDLDHFSELNNLHGHQVGDEVLRTFGAILRSRMRATDLVARYGGEEFCAVLFRADLDDAIRIADEVRSQLCETQVMGTSGEPLIATVSAGCSFVGPEDPSADELLRAADVALYMAKRAGRDRVVAA